MRCTKMKGKRDIVDELIKRLKGEYKMASSHFMNTMSIMRTVKQTRACVPWLSTVRVGNKKVSLLLNLRNR